MAIKKDRKKEDWIFWLAVILSVIGVAAIVLMALRILEII